MIKDRSPENWTKLIAKREMPVLIRTVAEIEKMVKDDQSPLSAISEIVLRDAAMTTKVLRVANTVYYSPAGARFTTVSRALLVLGLNRVCSICLTISLMDELLANNPRTILKEEMGHSLHAAVQAQALSQLRRDPSPEEVFIATLLFHIGEMAFWCFGGKAADELESEYKKSKESRIQSQRKVLGFTLSQLTVGLAEEWRLGKLLRMVLHKAHNPLSRENLITLSHEFVATVENGWDTEETITTIQKLADLCEVSAEELRPLLIENAKHAQLAALKYGGEAVAGKISTPDQSTAVQIFGKEEEPPPVAVSQYIEPDPILQLRIMQELSDTLSQSTDTHHVLEILLEGIYRGIGMDRALFALLTDDDSHVAAKLALGTERLFLSKYFDFAHSPLQPNLFFRAMETKEAVWIKEEVQEEFKNLLPKAIRQVVGHGPFYAVPVIVHGKSIGLYYADRRPSERPLDSDSFESLKHFVRLGSLCLEHIDSNSNQKD